MSIDTTKTYDIAAALNGDRRADELSRENVSGVRVEILSTIWRAILVIGTERITRLPSDNDTEFTEQEAQDIRTYSPSGGEFKHVTVEDLNLLLAAWRGLYGVKKQQ